MGLSCSALSERLARKNICKIIFVEKLFYLDVKYSLILDAFCNSEITASRQNSTAKDYNFIQTEPSGTNPTVIPLRLQAVGHRCSLWTSKVTGVSPLTPDAVVVTKILSQLTSM